MERGVPVYLRSHNGPELMALQVRNWRRRTGVTTVCIEAGSPWENAPVESFTGQFRDGGPNREIFCIRWRGHKGSWNAGGRSATGCDRTVPWAIGPQLQKQSNRNRCAQDYH